MIILIPSFQPDQRLVDLVMDLAGVPGARVVVVDDGSCPDFRSWFDGASIAGAEVLTHPDNRGKGAALRAGFRHALAQGCQAVLTLDAEDGIGGGFEAVEEVKHAASGLGALGTAGADEVGLAARRRATGARGLLQAAPISVGLAITPEAPRHY